MVDVNKLLGQLLNSGFAGGIAGGLTSSMLTSKSGKKLGKNVLKLGGVAAVGALAYTAYQRYSNSRIETSADESDDKALSKTSPPGSAFASLQEESNHTANEALALTLVRAMIAAARSDGRLDAQESQAIFQKINSMGLDSESQNLLVQEMGYPVDIDAIINNATSLEIAMEIYIASLLAIDVDNSAEKAYLAMLAARLQLAPDLVTELESEIISKKAFAQ